MESEVLCQSLLMLATEAGGKGVPLQAIKCLQGMLSLALLPGEEVKARVKLAQLLLDHTRNVQEAKQHLQHAVGTHCELCQCCSLQITASTDA